MFRKSLMSLCLMGALGVLYQCSDSGNPPLPLSDAGPSLEKDAEPWKEPTFDFGFQDEIDSGPVLDQGGTAADGSVPTGATCAETDQCIGTCKDEDCVRACFNQTSEQVRDAFLAMYKCVNTAEKEGACKASCESLSTEEEKEKCIDCINVACPKEIKACFDPALPGFGQACSAATPCPGELTCHYDGETQDKGFCTKTCDKPSTVCSGGPGDTIPACIWPINDTEFRCLFMCEIEGKAFPCPLDMECEPVTDPPETQRTCVPK